jgi:hypothetical protein
MDDSNVVSEIQQIGELLLHGGEAPCLYLDQQVFPDEVDHEAVNRDFDAITGPGVPPLQRRVERLLSERPDMRDLRCDIFHGDDRR